MKKKNKQLRTLLGIYNQTDSNTRVGDVRNT